jgi:hypothetical protein
MISEKYFEEFASPQSIYRGIPFWAWNGELDRDELRRQIRIMKKMGLGGFFMHSRIGLVTEYLSDDWFECIKACVDEARANGLNAWLYDEDRWPSGAAGGKITVDHKYRQKLLIMEVHDCWESCIGNDYTVAVFAVSSKDGAFGKMRKLPVNNVDVALAENEKVLHFYVKAAADDDWFNGQAYLDTLSIAAVDKFIETTHEKYKSEVSDEFGKSVPGIFSDEPRYAYAFEENEDRCSIAWSDELPELFKKRYGYDLAEHLPELFFDLDTSSPLQARYHYFDCVTFMFVEAFGKRIGQWCADNNLMFTGHLMNEDTLSAQTSCVGSCMRFYEYMQIPGMDLLTEHYRIYDAAKQVGSAARQFDKKWRLSETYGCTGWDFSFAGHKALGDWQVALGINMRAQHLSWYTMQGEAKRDYPASILHQSPWWEIYSEIEDYFARLNLLMSEGREIRDLLVIHPNESMWLKLKRGWREDLSVSEYDGKIIQLRDALLKQHLDFDYGDEDILARYAKVFTKDNVAGVKVGSADYKAVIVPEVLTMRSTTLELLKEFKAQGGQVVFIGKIAELLDGVSSKAVVNFSKECQCISADYNEKDLNTAFGMTTRRVSIADVTGNEIPSIIYQLRENDDFYALFICNTGHSGDEKNSLNWDESKVAERHTSYEKVNVCINAEWADVPLEMYPDNGEIYQVDKADLNSGGILTSMNAIQSRIFIFPKTAGLSKKYPVKQQYSGERVTSFGQRPCIVELSEDNVVVLDTAKYRINDGVWCDAKEILRIDQEVRASMGMPSRAARGKQPWVLNKECKEVSAAAVELVYEFSIKELPEKVCLAIENPDHFSVELNGKMVDLKQDVGSWHDISMRKIELDNSLLAVGVNTLKLHCNYTSNFSGLEMIYLLGNFGVRLKANRAEIIAPVNRLKLGDWTPQGLPFYAGAVRYKYYLGWAFRTKTHLFLKVPEFHGAAIRVIVNNNVAGVISCSYQEIDIFPFLIAGSNEIIVEVFGHCRNSHGPLHLDKDKTYFISPWDFITNGNEWTDDYVLVSCGLISSPLLIIKELRNKLVNARKTVNTKESKKWNSIRKVREVEFSPSSNSSL